MTRLRNLWSRGLCFALFLSTRRIKAQEVVVDDAVRCLTADEFEPSKDYFENSKFEPREYIPPQFVVEAVGFTEQVEMDTTTDLFSISYHNHYKIVTNHFVNKTYLLYLCGTKDQIPAQELQGNHHLVLEIPHKGGVIVTETPQIPFLELLGVRREMIGYIGDSQWVSSPCMNYMMHNESSIDIVFNEGAYNATIDAQLQAEFLQEHPDAIIFGGPYGDKEGDRVVIAAATQERTNVATFDWIGYFAAFFNLEATSNDIAAATKARYNCSSSNAAILSADRTDRPTVLWANYFEGYNWSVAECPTWDATYYCEYAAHCGANIISRPEGFGYNDPSFGGNYWYLDDDQLLDLGKDADYFVYSSYTWEGVYERKKEMLDQIKAVQNKQVYDTQGPGSNAWYEQRLAEYDVVALDFCEMVGTASNAGTEQHTRVWLRNLFTEPVGTLPDCNAPEEIDQPYVAKGAECFPLEPPSNLEVPEGGEAESEPVDKEPSTAREETVTENGTESNGQAVVYTASVAVALVIAAILLAL